MPAIFKKLSSPMGWGARWRKLLRRQSRKPWEGGWQRCSCDPLGAVQSPALPNRQLRKDTLLIRRNGVAASDAFTATGNADHRGARR